MKEHRPTMTEAEKSILEKIVLAHEGVKEIQAIAIVGSISKGLTTHQDVDLLVLHNSTDQHTREKFAQMFSLNRPYVLDDALRFSIEGNHEVSLAYKNIQNFTKKVYRILNGQEVERTVKSWAIGGFVSETLLSDVANAVVIFDKEGSLSSLVDSLDKYPQEFRSLLIAFLEEEINQKLKGLVNKSPFITTIASADLQIAALRLMFALQSEFFPGIKHLDFSTQHWDQENKSLLRQIYSFNPTYSDVSLFEKLLRQIKGRVSIYDRSKN